MRTIPVVLIACAAMTARAETKIAVPDMKVTGAEASLGPILTEIMTTEMSQITGITVVGSSDIKAMLGFEQEKQLLGCADDVSCMAEIGGALGVDMLLVSDLGLVGDTHVLNLKLIDTADVKVLNRLYKTVTGKADALIETVRNSLPELLAPMNGAQVKTEPPPGGSDTPPTPETPVSPPVKDEMVTDSGPSTWPMWTLMGVGGAALLAGSGLRIVAKNEYNNAWDAYDIGDNSIHSAETEDRLSNASRLSKAALALFITGGTMVAGGLTWWLLTPNAETDVAVAPLVGDHVTGLAIAGGF